MDWGRILVKFCNALVKFCPRWCRRTSTLIKSFLMMSKLLQKGSKMGPRRARIPKWWLKMWANEPQGCLGEPQGGPRRSQDASKKAQDDFSSSPRGAKIGPRRPKMGPGAQDASKEAQEGCKRAPGAPLGPSWASNFM